MASTSCIGIDLFAGDGGLSYGLSKAGISKSRADQSTHPEAQAFQSPGGLFDRKNVLRSVYDLDFRGGHNTSPNVPYHVFQDVF